MPELLKPDLCVIGGGSGGLSVAAAAAAFGVPVVLVEKSRMGGDCLNTGCVPSKALLAAARRARAVADAETFGVLPGQTRVDFSRVRAHVQRVIAAIAPNDSTERFAGLGVRVIAGEARFKDRATVAVDDDIEIMARRFVIASGSRPAVPPIPGLDTTPFLTNETVFDLAECPTHLVVLGAGPVGLELAQAFRRLGAAVTVLEAAEPLAQDDGECARAVVDQLGREGVVLHTGITVTGVSGVETGVEVMFEGPGGPRRIGASHLLIAVGRSPALDGLGLDAAGIRYVPAGISVDKGLRTTNRRVYAIGDVIGGPQFTHAANYHASLVIRNALFRLPVRIDTDLIPRVTFTDPELAHVGLTEVEARRRGYAIRVLRWPYHENDRAQAERATVGHIKVVTNRRGRILGATIVGAGAGELINTWSLAVARKLNIRAIAGMIMPYPTLAEIGKRAATTYFTTGLTSPLMRRILTLLRRFG